MPADTPPPRPLILAPSGGPIVSRLVSALTLRADFYDAVTADTAGTGPACAIVCLIALVRNAPFIYEISQTSKGWGLYVLLVALLAILRWLAVGLVAFAVLRVAVWALVGALIGLAVGFVIAVDVSLVAGVLVGALVGAATALSVRTVWRGAAAADLRSLLRVLAYADAPTMLLAIDPWMPPLSQRLFFPDIAMAIWIFGATTVALRAASKAPLARAAAVAVPVYFAAHLALMLISQ